MNIMFSGDNPGKIRAEIKTFTARFWKQKPPAPGDIVTASTGYKKETRFAKLQIIQVVVWEPDTDNYLMYIAKTGYTPQQIAEKEGFKNFDEFFDAYASLNNHLDPYDPERTHYLIEFKLIELL